jgi:succinate-semialdehyde dehydrogenase/glutarate-semialdehyde dehydrogenase
VYSAPEDLDFIMGNPKIHGVSFTGSAAAGRKIAETAGKHLKKSVLELGGMDPFVVMEDADIDFAVELAVTAKLANCGQVCVSPKRFIIPQGLMDEFAAKVVKGINKAKMGDPLSPETTLGPMSSEPILNTVVSQVEQSIAHGDEVLTGGKVDPKNK